MAKITGKTKVWINSEWYGPVEIERDGSDAINHLTYTDIDMSGSGRAYVCIGTAEITLDLVDDKTMIDNKVQSLRAEVKAIKAKAEAQATALEGKIQQLLAITNESSAS